MPEIWPRDAASRSLEELGLHTLPETFLFRNSSCVRRHLGNVSPCRQTYKSLPRVYPSRAQLGQEDGRAWSGPHVKAIKSEKCQGHRPSHSIADVLYRHTCEKGLGGHHTSNRMSSDSLRRGELRGHIRNVDGIYNPPTEGLFGSRHLLVGPSIPAVGPPFSTGCGIRSSL